MRKYVFCVDSTAINEADTVEMKLLVSYLCDIIHQETGRYPTSIEDDPHMVALVARRAIRYIPEGRHKEGIQQIINTLLRGEKAA